MDGITEGDEPRTLFTLGELMAMPMPALPPFLPLEGTVGILSGPSGIGASWLALQIAISVACGRDVWNFGMGKVERGKVAVLNGIDPAVAIRHRVHALGGFLTAADRAGMGGSFLADRTGDAWEPLDQFARWLRVDRPVLVVLDRPERCFTDWPAGREPVMPALLRLEQALGEAGTAAIMVMPSIAHEDCPGWEPPFHAPWRGHLLPADPEGPLDQRRLTFALDRSSFAPVRRAIRRGPDGVLHGATRRGRGTAVIPTGR